jgi:hypothetical protein
MARPNVVLAVTLLAMLVIAACTSAAVSPAASQAVGATPPATASPATPSPASSPQPAPPTDALADFSPGERYLLDGVLRGVTNCQPAAGSDEQPRDAVAGIECDSSDPSVARVAFYLFAGDQEMLKAYLAEMRAVGIELESGSCDDRGGEHSYAPGVDVIIERVGCFLDDEARANYRALLPGAHVAIAIRGQSDDMRSLEDFAWLGNQHTPGNPTLWAEPR